MFLDLWYLNLFLIAHVLALLAFAAFGWLYIDTYQKDKSHKHNLQRGIGLVLISFSFFIALFSNLNETGYNSSPFQMVLIGIGLAFVFFANFHEPIPLLPSLEKPILTPKGRKKKKEIQKKSNFDFSNFNVFVSSYFKVIGILSSLLLPFIGVLMILAQNKYKVDKGLSKEFKNLNWVWGLMSFNILIISLNIIGADSIVWIDELTRTFASGWLINQLVLITVALLIFKWIYHFISFRIFAKVFISIWQITIFISVLIASIYSIFTISNVENQIVDLLGDNVEMVRYNIDQVQQNNEDLISLLSQSDNISQLVQNQSLEQLGSEIDKLIQNNRYLDQLIVTDEGGLLLYNSDNPQINGISVISNPGIAYTVATKNDFQDYIVADLSQTSSQLVYQMTKPIYREDNMIGIISSVKRFDDVYLDILKDQTSQEILIYTQNRRSASTLTTNNELRRLENLPHFKGTSNYSRLKSTEEVEFGRATIYTTNYYTALSEITNNDNLILSDLVVASEQSLLMKTNEETLRNTFLFALFISILSTIPSYLLARSIEQNFS